MWEFYWWIKHLWRAEGGLLKLGYPIKADQLPIKGIPMKYELTDGWTIPGEDLKYLIKGPLVAEKK